MIQLVTDSAAMLPDDVRQRFGISVVAITVTVNGQDFAEGVDLDIADFYAEMAAGATVSTAAPPPGTFVETYRAAEARGATSVLSVHTGATYSATLASARIAADLVDIGVTLVDTGVGSFPVALAVWDAAEALEHGASIEEAAAVAERTASGTGSLFVVGVPAVARRGGRFVGVDGELTPTTVLELSDGTLHDRGAVADLDTAIDVMVDGAIAAAALGPLRIGVGHAVHRDVADRIRARLAAELPESEIVIYEVGPSVGAHTGPGTLGIVHTPLRTADA
jgi:DegV family protein with EDD domain